MSEKEHADEDAFLTDEDPERRRLAADERKYLLGDEKVRMAALIAHSKLRSWSIAILLCISLFLGMVSFRLELSKQLRWPVYIDFIPLVILPCFVYLAATDFAATRISVDAALAKVTIIIVGFIIAVQLMLLAVFVCLKLTGIIEWRWTYVLIPFWCMLVVTQLFFCQLIPGFVQMDRLQTCFAVFAMIWLVALSVLVTSLKLDGELSDVQWYLVFIPFWLVMIYQISLASAGLALPSEKSNASERNSHLDVACIVALSVGSILIPLQLEGIIELSWGLVLAPPQIAILLACVQIWHGKEMDK